MLGILWIFVPCLYQHLFSDDAPHCPYTIFPLGLILPILYSLFLIRKKLKQTEVIFWLWCAGWLISFVKYWLENWLEWQDWSYIGLFLEVIVAMPTYAFLQPWVDTSNVYEYSVPIRALNGIAFIAFLLIGIKGLKQTIKAEANK